MQKIRKEFRLTEEAINALEAYAQAHNMTTTEALEHGITLLSQSADISAISQPSDLREPRASDPTSSSYKNTAMGRNVLEPRGDDERHSPPSINAREHAQEVLGKARKLTSPQEKVELMLDIWKRKRQIDVNAKADLADRLARIKERYKPMRNTGAPFGLGTTSDYIEPSWDNGL